MSYQQILDRILDRIENRAKQVCSMNGLTLKLIARPVFADRPMITPAKISNVFPKYKRILGGVCRVENDSYLELNEYGIVYYATELHEREGAGGIRASQFIGRIAELLQDVKRLYGACEASVNIEVVAELVNVLGKKLSSYISGSYSINPPNELVCNVPEVHASTSDRYLSRDFNDATKPQKISEELTLQLLGPFDVPTENEDVIKLVKQAIETN